MTFSIQPDETADPDGDETVAALAGRYVLTFQIVPTRAIVREKIGHVGGVDSDCEQLAEEM